jgi:ABC-type lipoprotein release transport system permease subunit
MREVLAEGARLAVVGCVCGVAAAAIAARLLATQLYAVEPRDPLTYAAATAVILSGAIVACWIPARRATAISPMDALRAE